MEKFQISTEFAKNLDRKDPLRKFRNRFFLPAKKGKQEIYFCGNSLGLQPRTVRKYIEQELNDWARLGVEGHLHARNPWVDYHKPLLKLLSKVVGARPSEVIAMNSLTVNLHLMMATFYRPENGRCKILVEAGSFPSSLYALQSQVRWHGLDPDECIIEVKPRENEFTLRTEDILQAIKKLGSSLALVMFGGVNYYTGQAFDLKSIAAAAHKAGAVAGYDLAHAAGNIPLKLHDWNVDFAVWCSYKYLNSGPGSVGGAFIHSRHSGNIELPRLTGWWGHQESDRFRMSSRFQATATAEGWQLSNAPVLSMAAHRASLELFEEAGMKALSEKSRKLCEYLEFVIREGCRERKGKPWLIKIITPSGKEARGAQISLLVKKNGEKLFEYLRKKNITADYRNPGVIRIAPVPLYNTFEEVYRFGKILSEVCAYDPE